MFFFFTFHHFTFKIILINYKEKENGVQNGPYFEQIGHLCYKFQYIILLHIHVFVTNDSLTSILWIKPSWQIVSQWAIHIINLISEKKNHYQLW